MQNLKPIIAKNIMDLRVAAGMTQLELAEKLSYTDKAISKWERGESVPDISVLVSVAELFGVTLDYLVHEQKEAIPVSELGKDKRRNRGLITGISVAMVWLLATSAYVSTDIALVEPAYRFLAFIWAVPLSAIVWLILNSIWFNQHNNYIIISILMWSLLASVYVTLLMLSLNIWILFVLGIPGQIIILMWSGIKIRRKNKEKY